MKRSCIGILGVLCAAIFLVNSVYASPVLEKKTLNRWVDPVCMDAKLLKEFIGKPISSLRVYAHKNGSFDPIRFQIDEMTGEGGDWVLPSGPKPNSELGNGRFDPWDKILFMANDTGDRVSSDAWIAGYADGIEIKVIDPLTKEEGWCYALFFDANVPPKSTLPDYMVFTYKNEGLDSDCLKGRYMITKDGLHSTYYDLLCIPESAGGSGKNFVDRLKIRVTLKVFMGSVTIHANEEQLKSDVLAYKQGPIRWVRRSEQYKHIPSGMKALRVINDIIHYRNVATVPVSFSVPFRLDTVLTSAVVRFGTDYSEEVLGSKLYSSTNPKGFLVNGKMDETEKNFFNPHLDEWRIITGTFGTFITRTILTPEIKQDISISMGYIDDVNQKHQPERYPGTIGYLYQDWSIGLLTKGKYYLFLEFYYPPHYKSGDEVQYVNYMEHPLKVQVEDQAGTSQLLIIPNVGKKYL